MTPLVRPATLTDVARIVPIYREVHQLHVDNRPDTFKPLSDSELAQCLHSLLEGSQVRFWLADCDAQTVGYAGVAVRERLATPFSVAASWWELDQIGVLATHRRKGVGRALVERVVADAQSQGVQELELNSWAFNQSAHRAFESYGFTAKSLRFELFLQHERK